MESTVETKNSRKWIFDLREALTCENAMIFYHIVAYAILVSFAYINGNDTFLMGTLAAFAVILAEVSITEHFFSDLGWRKRVVEFFHLNRGSEDSWREYIFYLTLPIIILLLSSCVIFTPPIGINLCSPVAVIENSKQDSMRAVNPWRGRLFMPGKERVKWFPTDQMIPYVSMLLKTKDGRTIQVEATIHFQLKLDKNRESIKRICRRFGSNNELRNQVEETLKSASVKVFSRYSIMTLPSRFVLEEKTWSEMDKKRFEIDSGYIEISDMHRY